MRSNGLFAAACMLALLPLGANAGGERKGDDPTAINFTGPKGMKVVRQLPDGSFEANVLKEANFEQGQVYRLRVTRTLADRSVERFYPTLQIAPASKKTAAFLKHSSVPVTFSDDDFTQAQAGTFVVKVIYLPDPQFQDFSTIVGAEEIVSTQLEPGVDPVEEANRRGTILAILRMGNIDLEERPVRSAREVIGPGSDPATRGGR